MKVKFVLYSMYGYIYKMAVAEGAREVEGAEVELLQVPETVPGEVLEESGGKKTRESFAPIPVTNPVDVADAGAMIFGTPTRFGNMCAQTRNFFDQTGGLWVNNTLIGKFDSVFTSSGMHHGGQETTITTFHSILLHHGMVIAGLPCSEVCRNILDEMTGGSLYGAGTIASSDGILMKSKDELAMARFQSRHVADIAKKLAGR